MAFFQNNFWVSLIKRFENEPIGTKAGDHSEVHMLTVAALIGLLHLQLCYLPITAE